MTLYNAGDICLVPFPFTDLQTTKKRPALVLSRISSKKMSALYIVAMVTSQVDSEMIEGDYLLSHFKESGLLHPSKVRLSKMVTLEEKIILQKLGSLNKKDLPSISKVIKSLFKYWF